MVTDLIQKYISTVYWRPTSSARYKDYPHEYTVKSGRPDLIQEFEQFVMHIREKGYQKKFQGLNYTYFDFEGYTYWTMGSPLRITTIINRVKI